MKTTSIEITADILSAIAANPNDTRLAAAVCAALVKAAAILDGAPATPDTSADSDPDEIVRCAQKRHERRKAAAEKRAIRRRERDSRLKKFLKKGIPDTRLTDLKAAGILTATELRVIEAMLRPTIQLTNKLTSRQLTNILHPRIRRLNNGDRPKKESPNTPPIFNII